MSLSKLRELKHLFDRGSLELSQDYWTEDLLQIYSETLGERIKWKWECFLVDLHNKQIHPEEIFTDQRITDWACGPGTAALALSESYKNKERLSISDFHFEDRSPLAVRFAKKRLQTLLTESDSLVSDKKSAGQSPDKKVKVMLISYVLSELTSTHEQELMIKLQDLDAFLWVDSGAFKESRRLSNIRNELSPTFTFLSPCPHQLSCPLSGEKNPQDWCHRFAKTPGEVFHSAKWGEFANVMKVDLRSLPYSSLYAVKKHLIPNASREAELLSRPRIGKHEILWDTCTPQGTYETRKITKRLEPELYKRIKKQ